MGLFSRNKEVTSKEYEILIAKIVHLTGEVQLLQKEVDALQTNGRSLRGLINRKLGKKSFEEVEDEQEEEEEEMSEQEKLARMQRAVMGMP